MFTDNNIKRIGFACKWSEVNQKDQVVSTEGLNTGGTTLTWLRNNPDKAEDKMWEVMERNLGNTYNLVSKVATLPQSLRMVRLTSDMMTGYTHPEFSYYYKRADVINRMEQLCAPIGEVARKHNVRLSFHPGQFTVLASETDRIVDNSIEEIEYHVDMARAMGYGKTFQDFKINVHIS